MSPKKMKKRLSKALVKTSFEFRYLNCLSGCHKHHIALFRNGEQVTEPTDNPAVALQLAAIYFNDGVEAYNGFLADAGLEKSDEDSSEKSDDSNIDAFTEELIKEISSLFGSDVRVSVMARRKASDLADSAAKATPAASGTNQTAG